jgi:hypothetical protein
MTKKTCSNHFAQKWCNHHATIMKVGVCLGCFVFILFVTKSLQYYSVLPKCSSYKHGRCVAMTTSPTSKVSFGSKIHKVAIIGAGAAGLAAARELKKDFDVHVLEQAGDVGGVWQYTDDVEESLIDPLLSTSKPDAGRVKVHSSMYRSLRTNLPREVMQYSDYPFSSNFSPLRYPHHTAVLAYLQAFARDQQLLPLVRFHRRVVSVERIQVFLAFTASTSRARRAS